MELGGIVDIYGRDVAKTAMKIIVDQFNHEDCQRIVVKLLGVTNEHLPDYAVKETYKMTIDHMSPEEAHARALELVPGYEQVAKEAETVMREREASNTL